MNYEMVVSLLLLSYIPIFIYIMHLKPDNSIIKKTLKMWEKGAKELNEDFKKAIAEKKS